MKRISAGGRERSDLRHFHRRILPAGLLVAFLMAAVLMVAVQVSANNEKSGLTWQQLAQETGGYWQLVDTIPDPVRDEQKRVDTIRSGVLCATETNSLSEGSFTHQKEWYKGESFFPCEHNKFSNFAAVATWGRPPERITPGTTLSLEADVITTANDPGDWGSSLTLGITTDAPHTTCGYLTGGAKVVCSMIVSSHHEYEKEDCVLEVGAGRSEGEQFALRYCMAPSPCGYRYVYEWVPAEEKPADTGPQPPKPEPPKPDDSGTGTGVEGPSSSDSGSSSSGGSGSILGPLAVLGTLGALGVLGVVGVVGAAAAAILAGVLKGGAAAGGAASAAAVPGVGSVPDVAPDSLDDLLDELLDDLDREIEAPEETDEDPEPEAKKKPRRREDETDPETEALDEGEAPEAEAEAEDPGEEPETETEVTEDVGESEAEAEIEDPGEEPATETEVTEDVGESEAEGEIEKSGDASKEEKILDPVTQEWKTPSEMARLEIERSVKKEIERLADDGVFIANKTGFRKGWNYTAGQVTNRIRGWNADSYCGEMVEYGKRHLQKILPDAHISMIIIERNSKINHIANRVILKDGTELIVDYWESLATGKPAIYTPEAWLKKWEKELGQPLWGDWLRRDLIDHDQTGVVRHVLKHGEGGVENFWESNKTGEPLRNWWKNLDPEKKKTLKDQVFQNNLSPKEQQRYIYAK